MFTTMGAFDSAWEHEAASTARLLDQLTDASLAQAVEPAGRTLGRLAWHIVTTIPEMGAKLGLNLPGAPGEHDPVPATAQGIRDGWRAAAEALDTALAGWTDATLLQEDDMYGERWSRGFSLMVLLLHLVHHRGQMTVLMRQAGLPVPGVYGPSRDEWGAMGMTPPPV